MNHVLLEIEQPINYIDMYTENLTLLDENVISRFIDYLTDKKNKISDMVKNLIKRIQRLFRTYKLSIKKFKNISIKIANSHANELKRYARQGNISKVKGVIEKILVKIFRVLTIVPKKILTSIGLVVLTFVMIYVFKTTINIITGLSGLNMLVYIGFFFIPIIDEIFKRISIKYPSFSYIEPMYSYILAGVKFITLKVVGFGTLTSLFSSMFTGVASMQTYRYQQKKHEKNELDTLSYVLSVFYRGTIEAVDTYLRNDVFTSLFSQFADPSILDTVVSYTVGKTK